MPSRNRAQYKRHCGCFSIKDIVCRDCVMTGSAVMRLLFGIRSQLPRTGTHQKVNAYWPHQPHGILQGSLVAALIACDAINARTVTKRKYHYALCLSSPSLIVPIKVEVLKAAKQRSLLKLVRAGQQRESFRYAVIRLSKGLPYSLAREVNYPLTVYSTLFQNFLQTFL